MATSAAELLRTARRRAGISQDRLAIRLGTSQDAVSRVERGAEQPTIERLRRMLNALGEELRMASERPQAPASEVAMSPAQRLRESASWNLAATRLELAGRAARAEGHPSTRAADIRRG